MKTDDDACEYKISIESPKRVAGVLQFNVAPICIASNLVSGVTDFILTKNGAQISSGAWNKQIGLLVASLCQTPPFRWLSCWLGFFLLDQTGRSAAGAPRSGTRDGSTTWATPIRKQTAAWAFDGAVGRRGARWVVADGRWWLNFPTESEIVAAET